MWNRPSDEELAALPRLYETEEIPLEEKVVGMHFFLGGCDLYPVEYSPDERLFFGYTILFDDHQNAEWGYFSLDEIVEIRTPGGLEVDRDPYWTPTKVRDIDRIRTR